MAIDDKKHRELMTKFIEYAEKEHYDNEGLRTTLSKKYPAITKEFLIEVEKPYNHYGSRGFIDVLFSVGFSTSICEVKPVLYNLGEAIRQLRRAQDAIKKNAITDFHINDLIYLRLVTNFSEENIAIIRKSYSILKNIKELIIDLYCEYNDEFYFITSNSISNYMIEKYGDPLLHRWEMCKNKESQNDMEALQRAKTKILMEKNR